MTPRPAEATKPRYPKGTTRNPQSIWAWLAMNYDLSPTAQREIYVIAVNDILGPTDAAPEAPDPLAL